MGDPRRWGLERGDRCRGVRAHTLGARSAFPPEPAVRPGLVTGPDPPVGGLTLVGSAVTLVIALSGGRTFGLRRRQSSDWKDGSVSGWGLLAVSVESSAVAVSLGLPPLVGSLARLPLLIPEAAAGSCNSAARS